jgi:prevent-host-death family protein
MKIVDLQDAKAGFADLMFRVSRGQEITIVEDGIAIARVVPLLKTPSIEKYLGVEETSTVGFTSHTSV